MDHQWIHKAGAETSFGGPIAHGLLSLSLLPALMEGVLPAQSWVGHELNCGFNRVRFVSPVQVGAQVRVTAAKLIKVKRLGGGGGGGGGGAGGDGFVSNPNDAKENKKRSAAAPLRWKKTKKSKAKSQRSQPKAGMLCATMAMMAAACR
jgi:hypothetical protein